MNIRSAQLILPVLSIAILMTESCSSTNTAAESESKDSAHYEIHSPDTTVTRPAVQKDTAAGVKLVLDLYNDFEKSASKLPKKEMDVEEESGENASVELTENKRMGIGRIRKQILGEMQQVEESFYYRLSSEELLIATIKELAYQKPLTPKGATEQKIYQIFSGGTMIAMLDEERDRQEMTPEKMQVAEKDSKEYFKNLLKLFSEKKKL